MSRADGVEIEGVLRGLIDIKHLVEHNHRCQIQETHHD